MATPAASTGWWQRLISELDESDGRAEQLTGGLSVEQLNWKAQPGAWSIGQCLRHLYITNDVYLGAIAGCLEGAPRGRVREITPGWFGAWFIRSFVAPSEKTRKVRAPKKIDPGETVEDSILELFLQSNRTAREVITRAAEYDVNRIRFQNPFLPLIRFTAGTGLEIVSKHQMRHLLQGERVREAMAG